MSIPNVTLCCVPTNINPFPNSKRNFSICLTRAFSKSDSIIGLFSGSPKNSKTYGSFTISSGLAISFPYNANSRTFFLFASPFDNNNLSNNEVLICLFNSLTDQFAFSASFS